MESIYCRTTPKSGILWVQKWSFNMSSALERARTLGMAGLFTVLSLGLASNNNKAFAKLPASPDIEMFADNPGDGGKNDAAKNDGDNQDRVRHKNLSNKSHIEAGGFAASASAKEKGLVIFYAGESQETYTRIIGIANRLYSQGYKVVGVVQGKTDPIATNGKEAVAVFINGGIFGDFDTDLSDKKIERKITECLTTMGYKVAQENTTNPSNDLVAK